MTTNYPAIKNFTASGEIKKGRIVMASDDDGKGYLTIAQADGTKPPIGVSAEPADVANGERVDAQLDGIAEVVTGGPITGGTWVKSDSIGRAIAAAEASTISLRIGQALQSANASALYIPIMLK